MLAPGVEENPCEKLRITPAKEQQEQKQIDNSLLSVSAAAVSATFEPIAPPAPASVSAVAQVLGSKGLMLSLLLR